MTHQGRPQAETVSTTKGAMTEVDRYLAELMVRHEMFGASPAQLLAAERQRIEQHYAANGGSAEEVDQTLEGLAALERSFE